MGQVIFWDVDTQHDFMVPDGRLYVPGAEHLAANLRRLTQYAHDHDIPIVASADDHTLEDAEISEDPDLRSTYPPHCMRGTPGGRKIPATAMRDPVIVESDGDPAEVRRSVEEHDGEILIRKQEFDVFSNPHTETVFRVLRPDHVILYGVALDVCNRLAIEGLLARGFHSIHVVADAVQALHPESVPPLLEGWLRRGVRTVTTDEVVGGGYLERLS